WRSLYDVQKILGYSCCLGVILLDTARFGTSNNIFYAKGHHSPKGLLRTRKHGRGLSPAQT
ncbi:MAG: hypothetical protein EBT99_11205, partial [Betaproteobacteria bacterium]|nr:hypothetical protein [Betaproteobacteria bacterium]NBQ79182.1 hypothetical protein [Betaproteobacteria bacterium]